MAILSLRWLCLPFAFAAWGSAHELEIEIQLAPPAVVAKASYGGTEAVPFAAVQVTPPEGKDPWPASKTDRRGYFSFVPDRAGTWKIAVDDEMGHRAESAFVIPERFSESRTVQSAGASRGERALTGIALMLGLTGILYGWRARKGGAAANS